MNLHRDALSEFFAMRDDAHAAIGLAGNLLQLLERGHDRLEAVGVEGAEALVDEEDVDVLLARHMSAPSSGSDDT